LSQVQKYSHFLQDPDVHRWLKSIERGSPITAEVTHRRFGRACELLSTTPQDMIKSARKNMKEFQDSLEDMVSELESQSARASNATPRIPTGVYTGSLRFPNRQALKE